MGQLQRRCRTAAVSLTDRGFTGQKENMELGLYYYNARYYLPGVGRFISADSLVPEPGRPQSVTYAVPHLPHQPSADKLQANVS